MEQEKKKTEELTSKLPQAEKPKNYMFDLLDLEVLAMMFPTYLP